jgi:hypothetical protein
VNPAEFWGMSVTPTLARNDPAFSDPGYGRGGRWGPTNPRLNEGINRYGLGVASTIPLRTRFSAATPSKPARRTDSGGVRRKARSARVTDPELVAQYFASLLRPWRSARSQTYNGA